MKFNDMQYTRPDFDKLVPEIQQQISNVKSAANTEDFLSAFDSVQTINAEVASQGSISYVRHTINTKDNFYDGENNYFDEHSPVFEAKMLDFYRAVLASPHAEALAKKYGNTLIEFMQVNVNGISDETIPLMQEENALSSRYDKIYASAQIPFKGQTLTLSQLGAYKTDNDRAVRREAYEAEGKFFDSCREEFDDIYDKLVKNRTEQAKTLGFDTFSKLGDTRMSRMGYTREDIAFCRNEVAKDIVPIVNKLKQNQKARLGVDKLCFFDDVMIFPDGNPKPKGTPEEILANGQKMYRSLSPETAEFIDFMMDNDLFDVLSRPGKSGGGYCTQIQKYKSPFIFSNFNGTAGDVDVLTHEAGHAFAFFRSMRKNLPLELLQPGYESCEIHSMSMEFLTAEYHDLFFKEETEKYSFSHTVDGLYFLPYGCMVDEFQETIYAQPNLTPQQRNDFWLELEKKYRPWINFEDLPFYSRGSGWQRQLHIYRSPMYYIDYVLAQAVAFEFFNENLNDKSGAWKRYLTLLEKAGTETYTGLVHSAGFKTPFEAGTMKKIGTDIFAWLEKHPCF